MSIEHNFDQCFAALEREIEGRREEAASAVRAVAIQAVADIQRISPVDTGRFRASHQLSIDEVIPGEAPAGKSPGEYVGQTAERLNDANQRLAGIRRIERDLSIFICSSLPYAMALEHGHSKQAPAGVYAVAAQRAERTIARLGGKP